MWNTVLCGIPSRIGYHAVSDTMPCGITMPCGQPRPPIVVHIEPSREKVPTWRAKLNELVIHPDDWFRVYWCVTARSVRARAHA